MTALETYLRQLREIHDADASMPETSGYGTLEVLLNEIGKALKPKVRCIIQVKDQGAGRPDGGLFTADQVRNKVRDEVSVSLVPARGVIEVKPAGDNVTRTAKSQQVKKYLKRYRQVLVTNYWHFLLVGKGADGKPVHLEEYRLAEDEADFWSAARHPRRTATEHAERLTGYLKRVMLQSAPLAEPQDVAWFLASYAREGLARIEAVKDLPALGAVRSGLEEALGLKFDDEKGEHFFRSSLIQTLFYGVFSAWVLWSREHPPTSAARFNWHEAGWYLRVPMIQTLFQQVATPGQLGALDLVGVLDWTAGVLSRVDRAAFFSTFEEGRAVQYFYEPFLKAFDPQLRKSLGVWYTPPEIVRYMVARVDTVLREELGIADGLADRNVNILDPCCGTGAYLVEVLNRIAQTLREKGGDALAAHDLKRIAMERVFGFEILPAPFVVAHLQLGLFLQSIGAPLAGDHERVGVYLTNALTGWEPPREPKTRLLFPELEEERDAANRVKREVPILVILGNPPYSGFA